MIDRIRTLSLRLIRLKPICTGMALVSSLVFGYVVLFEADASKDIYLIPSVMLLLWSLLSLSLLSSFPYVPPTPTGDVRLIKRLKIRLIRLLYHIASWLFLALSMTTLWLSLRLLNVWRVAF
ncbi:hypothetical protein [Ferrimonas pelagia]|uniref:Uncharacterized protein n=1 Tax=Ferrimonas pelagia TaxID=1177826 RepID=A0ABP9EVV5_9GAMM